MFWKDIITMAIDIFNNTKIIAITLNNGILKQAEPVKALCGRYNLFAGWSVVSVVIWLVSAWWIKDNPRYR